MIDDYAKAQALVKGMKAGLPIPVRATAELARATKQFPTKIAVGQELAIKDVFYMGDEGGIMCDVTPPGMETTPMICSLTHLDLLPGHPLTDELRAYQAARTRKLAQQGSGKPMSYTIKPKKGRR
ncbi:MAG: hypothetical protein NT169_11695 [Chloroflexi bacterium]|nr:hypothetical protein [Chloroflexota bacterium]